MRLGAYNLTEKGESGVVERNVSKIYIHPDWNVSVEVYDADIAILLLSENFTYSNNIRPICIPSADDFGIEGIKGTVVGWGLTENETKEGIPWQTETNALNDSYCYRTDHGLARYASARSFCGGGGNGTPNNGDSGNGFFSLFGSTWVQYGIVSVVSTNATGHIVPSSFAVYMSVKLFKHWIVEIVQLSGGVVNEATKKIDLHCIYDYDAELIYGCWPHHVDIRKENFEINSITGPHLNGKTDKDVEVMEFENGTMFFLPNGVGNFFNNLKYLTVGGVRKSSLGTKRIRRSNLENLHNLEDLRLFDTDIVDVDEDALSDLPNLQVFRLENNKLEMLHATTFGTNNKLRIVYITAGALRSLPNNLFQNNSLLEIVVLNDNLLETIDERMFVTNTQLQSISVEKNRLEFLGKNLFQNNSILEEINFSNNAIKTIDEHIFDEKLKLNTVFLGSNKLESLPRNLFEKNLLLDSVSFRNNSLESLDELLFQTNIGIREVDLWSNQLKVLPSNLFRNNLALETVELGKNLFSSIDETLFGSNPMLWRVSIESNRLADLPRNLFQNNSMLEHVNASNNLIVEINEQLFEKNGKLHQVFLSGNYVKLLPGQLFRNNSLLVIIDVSNNSLMEIDEHSFRTNINLKGVSLSSNMLVFLPTKVFQSNLLLEIVNLSKNLIRTIDEKLFETNSKLKTVSLESNKLQALPRNLFGSNPLLKHVNFRHNSLKTIDIVFTEFKNFFVISLYNNTCIDAVFYNVLDRKKYRDRFTDLTAFQNLISANCTKG